MPWKGFHGVKPDVSILRARGCKAFVTIPTQRRGAGKWSPKGEEGILVGYDVQPGVQSNGYHILLPTGKIVSTHHVIFDELSFPRRSSTPRVSVPHIVFGSPFHSAGGAESVPQHGVTTGGVGTPIAGGDNEVEMAQEEMD